jgi:hypothetical protein
MGLLGDSWEDPRTAAILNLAGGLLSQRNLGAGLVQGMQGYTSSMLAAKKAQQDEEERKQIQAQRALQARMLEAQFADQMRAREEAAAAKQARGSYLDSIDSNAGPAMPVSIPQAMRAGLGPQEIQALMPAKAENPFGKVDPKDFTPESVRKFAMTNNYSDLVPVRKLEFVNGQAVDPFATAPGTVIPAQATEDGFIRLLRQSGVDPASPQGQQLLRQRLQKEASHQPGVSVSYGAPVAGMDTAGNPVFFQPDKAGGQPNIVPGVKPPQKDSALTESQAKAATFMSQMKAAEKELGGIPIDPTKTWSQVDVALAGGLTNFAASPAAQRARQAQEQWSESFLRFKTGAAATKDEVILNVRTFFPQPGDSADVIEQKQRMRQQAVQDIAFAAGQKATAQQGQQPAPARIPTKRWNPSTGKFEDVGG